MADEKTKKPDEKKLERVERLYVYNKDGAIYSLEVDPGADRGRTHRCRTEGAFWEGTKAEFHRDFEPL